MNRQPLRPKTMVTSVTVATMLFVGGCFHHNPITPAEQRVNLTVRERPTGQPVSGALVSTEFPAEKGLTDFVRQQLDYGAQTGLGSATTDDLGNADVPVMVTGPSWGPGPDQITGNPIAFRIKAAKAVEYLSEPDLHVGEVVAGSRFELQVNSIGRPYARHPR